MRHPRRRALQAATAATACLAMLFSGALRAPGAHAQYGVCYNDPLVKLDNGMTIDLTTLVQGDLSNIQGITYTLHVPAGVNVVSIAYPGNSGQYETVIPVSDDQRGSYDADTVVTSTQSVPALAVEAVLGNGAPKVNMAFGQTNGDIFTHVQVGR